MTDPVRLSKVSWLAVLRALVVIGHLFAVWTMSGCLVAAGAAAGGAAGYAAGHESGEKDSSEGR